MKDRPVFLPSGKAKNRFEDFKKNMKYLQKALLWLFGNR
jgi:hypothetical protein